MTYLIIDGHRRKVTETRRVAGWAYFLVYDDLGRPYTEHSVPSHWFDYPNGLIISNGHTYQRDTAASR